MSPPFVIGSYELQFSWSDPTRFTIWTCTYPPEYRLGLREPFALGRVNPDRKRCALDKAWPAPITENAVFQRYEAVTRALHAVPPISHEQFETLVASWNHQ